MVLRVIVLFHNNVCVREYPVRRVSTLYTLEYILPYLGHVDAPWPLRYHVKYLVKRRDLTLMHPGRSP